MKPLSYLGNAQSIEAAPHAFRNILKSHGNLPLPDRTFAKAPVRVIDRTASSMTPFILTEPSAYPCCISLVIIPNIRPLQMKLPLQLTFAKDKSSFIENAKRSNFLHIFLYLENLALSLRYGTIGFESRRVHF